MHYSKPWQGAIAHFVDRELFLEAIRALQLGESFIIPAPLSNQTRIRLIAFARKHGIGLATWCEPDGNISVMRRPLSTRSAARRKARELL
jgi:hypothetical protein